MLKIENTGLTVKRFTKCVHFIALFVIDTMISKWCFLGLMILDWHIGFMFAILWIFSMYEIPITLTFLNQDNKWIDLEHNTWIICNSIFLFIEILITLRMVCDKCKYHQFWILMNLYSIIIIIESHSIFIHLHHDLLNDIWFKLCNTTERCIF